MLVGDVAIRVAGIVDHESRADIKHERVAAAGGKGVLATTRDLLRGCFGLPGVVGAPARILCQRVFGGGVPFRIVPANLFVRLDSRFHVPLQPLLFR